MSSVIKSLLDDYARCKQATLEARRKYNKAREEAMSFLRYENQTKERIEERFAKVAVEESHGYFNGDGTIPSSNRAHYYNAYLVPLTMCKINMIRKNQADKCREAKVFVKHRQRIEERARTKLLKFFDDRTVYFVATVRDVKQEVEDCIKEAKGLPKDFKYENHDARTWGFYYDFNKAFKAVHNNITDLWECNWYQYVVIEAHDPGLLGLKNPFDEANCLWFEPIVEADEKGQKYCKGWKSCEQPAFAKGFCGWALS